MGTRLCQELQKLCRGHANLLCNIAILTDDPQGNAKGPTKKAPDLSLDWELAASRYDTGKHDVTGEKSRRSGKEEEEEEGKGG